MSVARQAVLDEHELYPIHEEDSLPENPEHEYQTRYLRDALGARLPQHWVTGEMPMYWIPGEDNRYVAPDVLVVPGSREQHQESVYLAWTDGPPLLVIEIGSESTFANDEGPKVERYHRDFHAREYLYCHAARKRLRMWRLVKGEILGVSPNRRGRMVSRTLDLEFGLDAEGFLRVYERSGEMLLSYEETLECVEQERQRAETLEQELERLRAELKRRNGSPDTGGEVT